LLGLLEGLDLGRCTTRAELILIEHVAVAGGVAPVLVWSLTHRGNVYHLLQVVVHLVLVLVLSSTVHIGEAHRAFIATSSRSIGMLLVSSDWHGASRADVLVLLVRAGRLED